MTGRDHAGDGYGAIIVNSPYKEFSRHDGRVRDIVLTAAKRTPKMFQIWFNGFSTVNNAYRLVYYLPLYFLAGTTAFRLVRRPGRDAAALSLLSLVAGYFLVFVFLIQVELRFRVFFDLAAMYFAALAVQAMWLDWGRQWVRVQASRWRSNWYRRLSSSAQSAG